MGYDPAKVQAKYDNDLAHAPADYVRFGRTVVPVNPGDPIEVNVSDRPPGSQ